MRYTLVVGSFAALCTTIAFLPQVIKTYRTKHTKDLSLVMLFIFAAGCVLWTAYGFLLGQIPIISANLITLALVVYILFMKLKHG